MYSIYYLNDRTGILDSPKYQMVRSVALLSCVDILQGDGGDVAIQPENTSL